MKTLVGSPEPEEPDRPEIVYCVTTLGPNTNGLIVSAKLGRFSLNPPPPCFFTAGTNTTGSYINWNLP